MSELRTYEKFVKLPGVVEIKWLSDDPEFCRRSQDLFHVQTEGIPDSYGKKDKTTTVQAVFVCKLCECELKSIVTLRAHAKGTKHLRMECSKLHEYTERNSAKLRHQKAKHDSDEGEMCADKLETLLSRSREPVVGVRYLQEVRNNREEPPLYVCNLCQGFVADSRVMSIHLLQRKHQLNYFEKAYGHQILVRKEDLLQQVHNEFEILGVEAEKMSRKTDDRLYRNLLPDRKKSVSGSILQSTTGRKRSSTSTEEMAENKFPRFVGEIEPQVDPSIVDEWESSSSTHILYTGKHEERSTRNNLLTTFKVDQGIDIAVAGIRSGIEFADPISKQNFISREEAATVVAESDEKSRLQTELNSSIQFRSQRNNLGGLESEVKLQMPSPIAMASAESISTTPAREPQDPIVAFHSHVAEWVKRCLNMYYYAKPGSGYERKIATPQDYGTLAKKFSHDFRNEEKASCLARGCNVEEIKIDNDMKNRMKLHIDMYFEKLPSLD